MSVELGNKCDDIALSGVVVVVVLVSVAHHEESEWKHLC